MNRTFSSRLSGLMVIVGLALTGCAEELQHSLTERDANEILVLLRKNDIQAEKMKEEGGNEPTYLIRVPRRDYGQSAELLREHSLPQTKPKGFAMFRESKGMIPTQTEERAMMLEAYSGEVSSALQKIDGVLEAQTIVNMPEVNDLTQPEKKALPSASVVVKYRSPLDGRPPLTEAQIRQFVATSIPDMRSEAVTVLLSQSMAPSADVSPETRLQEVLIFRMTASSARDFKIAVGLAALLIIALAGFTAWTFLRSGTPATSSLRSVRRQRPPEA